jgi:large subunit ribosomal protein L5
MSKAYEPRLKTKYREQIRTKLQEQFNYSNPMHDARRWTRS